MSQTQKPERTPLEIAASSPDAIVNLWDSKPVQKFSYGSVSVQEDKLSQVDAFRLHAAAETDDSEYRVIASRRVGGGVTHFTVLPPTSNHDKAA